MSKIDVSRQLRAFKLSASDLSVLRSLRPILEQSLETILVESRAHFSAWPEIERALAEPSMH